ncbi:uncharacterized protein Z518_06346 [Rhinocladiella mackenziei CBS 650.93]|uniref:N-acetyltransferase domain-containing protein n=1 Tax=Rhinocladiella mackenziei CBS 650.93 TaxID=1442369 RepID=A0A0D2IIA6_9EURO|nr:uncharacterized protein Z518_06346 [Rhinocladiella mackenziei CBS 650.93]KIX05474.1 hypothetical protein Z518_06346 [Rhinocladiella mackenziei CBS 650.93]
MSEDAPTAIAVSSATSTRENQISKRDLPKMTVGTSEEYNEKTASVLSHAMLPNVIWSLFSKEGIDGIGFDASDEKRLQAYHSIVKQFLVPGAESGAFIAEAGDFSACASWWPPGSHQPPKDLEDFDELERQGKTLWAAFGREIEKIKIEQIWSRYGQEFWHLGLLGRDPRKPAVAGAVRAVLQPFIDQAAAEGKPIWLVTTNEHARDIYLHFGWQVVRMVTYHGHSQWCMILYPPSPSKAC